jgi:pimeloyl-ACP methyl ester carboxylesterase
VTKEELQAIRVPVVILVGDRDPTNRLYVAPLRQVRSDWESIEIEGAGHLNCVVKPQFKEELKRWLDRHRGH